ncbi:MAG: methyltransferase domain-containing protein [Acidobacteria bacterium]|nr:methyltransferase domain-containing protein [Acidobacteriota bacterium]
MSTTTTQTMELEYAPRPGYAAEVDPSIASSKGKRIGILVVTYNATSTLISVLKRIPPVVWANVEEVAVFDDASPDSTFELAIGLKAVWKLPKLHVIRHEKNLGYGGNQKAGYRYFIDKGFDIVILLHGDGQYAPEILARMYHPIVEGRADAVFGSRMMRDYGGPLKGGMPLYKYVGNRILTTLENRALGLRLTEFHSGYRAYNLHALARMDFSRMTDDFHFDTEIIIKLQHQRMTILEVPIPTYYGTELCRVDGMRYAKDVVRAVWRYKQTVRSVTRAPEFAEYFVHYPIKHSRRSSHDYALRLVGRGHRVLDIGCGEGFFAAEVARNENRVSGVDALPLPERNEVLEQYVQRDLNAPEGLADAFGRGRFDRVLLLDVLEHMAQPERLLAEARAATAQGGEIVISVPNVANITVRLKLLCGRFDYEERGILDRTHLRFFTRRTARRFLEENGCEVLETRATVMPLELVFGLSPENSLMRAINAVCALFTAAMPRLFGYQWVFVARPRA